MSEIAHARACAGDRFGRLRFLRAAGDGERAIFFCVCHHMDIAKIEDLLPGTKASCPNCRDAEAGGGQARPRELITYGAAE